MYQTPNMLLYGITIGVDSGLLIEQNFNSSVGIIDSHNHSPGSGVQIQPNGLNINSDLTFQSNNATHLNSALFTSLSTTLTAAQYINCIYVVNGNLYFNDGLGDSPIQLTAGGAVNASSSGISRTIGGITATASFNASAALVVYSNTATTTPADIYAQSILLGNNSGSTNYLTLSAPASTPTYSLVLPQIPSVLSFVTLDTSGNLATASSVSAAQIANLSITGAQMANGTVTTTQLSANAVHNGQIDSSAVDGISLIVASGLLTINSNGGVSGTDFNASTTGTVFAYPSTPPVFTSKTGTVRITLMPVAAGTDSFISISSANDTTTSVTTLKFFQGGTVVGTTSMSLYNPTVNVISGKVPVGQSFIVSATIGTAFGYNLEIVNSGGGGGTSAVNGRVYVEDVTY